MFNRSISLNRISRFHDGYDQTVGGYEDIAVT